MDDETGVNSEDDVVEAPAEADRALEHFKAATGSSSIAKAAEESALGASVRKLTGGLERIAPLADQRVKWIEQFGKLNHGWVIKYSGLGIVGAQVAALNLFKPPAPVMNTLAESFRGIDRLTKNDWLLPQQSIVANLTQVTFGSSALTSWRASIEAHTRVGTLFANSNLFLAPQSKLIEDLKLITAAQVTLTDWAVRQDAGSRLLGEISGKPLGLWRSYIDDLAEEPSQDGLELSVATGRVGLGLLSGDVLASVAAGEQLVPEAVETVESEVLEPWKQGHLDSTERLYARLETIDMTVPDLLKGAWDNILRDGPAAASQAAYCVTEVLDRTLRKAAPDETVLAWHAASRRPIAELHQGKPTRALRAKYVARQVWGQHDKLVNLQYESLSSLIAPLQGQMEGIKHASTAEVVVVRNLLLTAESFMGLLFLNDVS